MIDYHFDVTLLMVLPITLGNEALSAKLATMLLFTSMNLDMLTKATFVLELLLAFLVWTPV